MQISMSSVRASAREAIEVLKVHQLRRDNAIIFEEIKALRKDVAGRQEDLSMVQEQIATMQDDMNRLCKSGHDSPRSSEQADRAKETALQEMESLKKA